MPAYRAYWRLKERLLSTARFSRRRWGCVAPLLIVAGAGWQSAAATILFDFNALADGANVAAVDAYMEGVLGAQGDVTVTGTRAERNYMGDNYVVGPVVTASNNALKVTPMTLGTSDYNVATSGVYNPAGKLVPRKLDSYLVNASGSDRIMMTFSFPVYAVSFDFEIFPDGTCPNTRSSCDDAGDENWPDFKFWAGNEAMRPSDPWIFLVDGIVPGGNVPDLPSDITAMADPTSTPSKTYAHSKGSSPTGVVKAPQFLGISGTWLFDQGVTRLEFVDWPRMIGIDNLMIDPDRPVTPANFNVPEPATLALFGLGLAGLPFVRRRKAA